MITEQEHLLMLQSIDELMDDESGSEELTELVDKVVEYEDKYYPMGQ